MQMWLNKRTGQLLVIKRVSACTAKAALFQIWGRSLIFKYEMIVHWNPPSLTAQPYKQIWAYKGHGHRQESGKVLAHRQTKNVPQRRVQPALAILFSLLLTKCGKKLVNLVTRRKSFSLENK